MDTWYVLDESVTPAQPVGPYGYEQLRDLAGQGRLSPSSRIARVGGAAWTEAGLEPALVGLFRGVPPQAPELALGAASSLPDGCPEFTFSSCANQTIAVFKSRWSQLLTVAGISFGGYLVLAGPQLFGAVYDAANGSTEPSPVNLLGVCCSGMLNIFVGLPFFYGCLHAATGAIRGTMKLGDVLIGFRSYGTTLVGSLFVVAVYAGVAMVAYIPLIVAMVIGVASSPRGGGESALILAGLIGGLLMIALLMVGAALVVMRLFFVPLVAIDPALGSMGVARAINYSWRASKGCGWSMTGALIVFSLIAALSFLLLCVGYIFIGLPLLMAMLAVMYETIYRRGAMLPQAPATVEG